ncbi:MAG TPA: hypothetical protein VI258_08585, partial [Rhodanobacteraceae bacterium]
MELGDLRHHTSACDVEMRDGDGQSKAAGTRASRVDVDDAVALAHERLVRVPGDDGTDASGVVRKVELREIVQNVDDTIFDGEREGFGKSLRPRTDVVVATHRAHGRERGEIVEDSLASDIAG